MAGNFTEEGTVVAVVHALKETRTDLMGVVLFTPAVWCRYTGISDVGC